MAQPTAYRHQGFIALNRADGSSILLTGEEAAVIAGLITPSAEAAAAVARHLDAHRNPLGSRHGE